MVSTGRVFLFLHIELQIDSLLPYGTNFGIGDATFPRTLDGAVGPIHFQCMFFGTTEDTLYVSHSFISLDLYSALSNLHKSHFAHDF